MSTEKQADIARVAPRSFSLIPSSLGEAMEIAKMIADSDFAPKDYKNKPANVMIAIQMGADVGLKPMQALQNIAVINGRPSIWGDAALALVQSADILERFHETIDGEGDKRTATCIVKRKGLPDEIKRTFSVADAKKANLWTKPNTPWITYPDRMLQMRARGFALRDAAADRLMGLILAEEAMDYPDAIDVQGTHVTTALPASIEDVLTKLPEPVQQKLGVMFDTLHFSQGQKLVKLNEFFAGDGVELEDAAVKLLEWGRDEVSRRATGMPRKPKEDTNGKSRQNAPSPVGTATPPVPDPAGSERHEPAGGSGPAVASALTSEVGF